MGSERDRATTLAARAVGMLPTSVPLADFAAKLEELWRGDRGAEPAHLAGLLTAAEAAQSIAARIETWLVEQAEGALTHGDWNSDQFVDLLTTALKDG